MSKFSEKGYCIKENAPIYLTNDMEKTIKWFEDIMGWYGDIDSKDETGAGCYGVVYEMPRELWESHLAPFTGIHLFRGEPVKNKISFMQVNDIEKMREYVISNGWDKITEITKQPWGGKVCEITTADGYIISIFE